MAVSEKNIPIQLAVSECLANLDKVISRLLQKFAGVKFYAMPIKDYYTSEGKKILIVNAYYNTLVFYVCCFYQARVSVISCKSNGCP